MTDSEPVQYECPQCNQPVELDWKACPNCGAQFQTEEPAADAGPPGPAEVDAGLDGLASEIAKATAASKSDEQGDLAALDSEFGKDEAASAAPQVPPAPLSEDSPRDIEAGPPPAAVEDDLGALEEEIQKAVAPPARPPPKRGGAPARLGGILGAAGLLLLAAGAAGAFVAVNWDTWVEGQRVSSIGGVQIAGILGMVAVTGTGAALLVLGRIRVKRGPAQAA